MSKHTPGRAMLWTVLAIVATVVMGISLQLDALNNISWGSGEGELALGGAKYYLLAQVGGFSLPQEWMLRIDGIYLFLLHGWLRLVGNVPMLGLQIQLLGHILAVLAWLAVFFAHRQKISGLFFMFFCCVCPWWVESVVYFGPMWLSLLAFGSLLALGMALGRPARPWFWLPWGMAAMVLFLIDPAMVSLPLWGVVLGLICGGWIGLVFLALGLALGVAAFLAMAFFWAGRLPLDAWKEWVSPVFGWGWGLESQKAWMEKWGSRPEYLLMGGLLLLVSLLGLWGHRKAHAMAKSRAGGAWPLALAWGGQWLAAALLWCGSDLWGWWHGQYIANWLLAASTMALFGGFLKFLALRARAKDLAAADQEIEAVMGRGEESSALIENMAKSKIQWEAIGPAVAGEESQERERKKSPEDAAGNAQPAEDGKALEQNKPEEQGAGGGAVSEAAEPEEWNRPEASALEDGKALEQNKPEEQGAEGAAVSEAAEPEGGKIPAQNMPKYAEPEEWNRPEASAPEDGKALEQNKPEEQGAGGAAVSEAAEPEGGKLLAQNMPKDVEPEEWYRPEEWNRPEASAPEDGKALEQNKPEEQGPGGGAVSEAAEPEGDKFLAQNMPKDAEPEEWYRPEEWNRPEVSAPEDGKAPEQNKPEEQGPGGGALSEAAEPEGGKPPAQNMPKDAEPEEWNRPEEWNSPEASAPEDGKTLEQNKPEEQGAGGGAVSEAAEPEDAAATAVFVPLENPLPLPRKKERRALEYDIEPKKYQMRYDYEVSEGDDFDLP